MKEKYDGDCTPIPSFMQNDDVYFYLKTFKSYLKKLRFLIFILLNILF